MARRRDCNVEDGLYVQTTGPRSLKNNGDKGNLRLELKYYGNAVVTIQPHIVVGPTLDIIATPTASQKWAAAAEEWASASPPPSNEYYIPIERNGTVSVVRYCEIVAGCGTTFQDVPHPGPITRVQCRVR